MMQVLKLMKDRKIDSPPELAKYLMHENYELLHMDAINPTSEEKNQE